MKTLLSILCIAFYFFTGHSQENYLLLTNNKNGKEKIINELTRVKIKTQDGQKIIGKLVILNEETVQIKKTEIPISEIIRIKRKSTGAAIVSTAFYLTAGFFLTIGTVGFIHGGWGVLTGIGGYGAGTLFAGLGALTNDFPGDSSNSLWTYKIVQIE